jgi:hypothetical protein
MRRGLHIVPLVCLVLGASVGVATAKTPSRVMIREDVPAAHRNELINQLRKITGWSKLSFTSDGGLSIDSPDTLQGSKSAQSLLARAVSGDKLIVLEDASSKPHVAFCRVVPGKWKTNDSARPVPYVILIDFTDFERIVGDKEARAAFHVGWGVLHEIDHVVSETEDSEVDGHLGECETHINAMRQEVGLPVRANYFYSVSPLKTDPNFNRRFVRLPFDQRDTTSSRTRRYWLTWDSTAVGGLTKDQSASVRALVQ